MRSTRDASDLWFFFRLGFDLMAHFGGIAVEVPALIQKLDLTAVFFVISLHQLMAKPLRQGIPSSGMLLYSQHMGKDA